MNKHRLQSEKETLQLANKIGEHLKSGMTILLEGDLGAGKTTFAKGIAQGLGIKRIVKSPTYTIIREYNEGRLPLYHMDLYRLNELEAEELGLDEYFNGEGITLVEWPSIAPDELPKHHLHIQLSHGGLFSERFISITPVGSIYEEWFKLI